ncbi:unnamed protein product, partial [Gadus morhua 'NCC']
MSKVTYSGGSVVCLQHFVPEVLWYDHLPAWLPIGSPSSQGGRLSVFSHPMTVL